MIAVQQLSDLSCVVTSFSIAMRPCLWREDRFERWRDWGNDGKWVLAAVLVKLRLLREVVLLVGVRSSVKCFLLNRDQR